MPETGHTGLRQFVLKLRSIAGLSAEEVGALSELPMTIEAYPANHDLAREWQRPSGCHLVLDGFACRHKSLPDGMRQILSFHTPGDVPDLQGMHLGIMDYGVSTLVPTTVGHLAHADLHDLTLRHPGIAVAFLRDTLIDAAIFREWLLSLGRRSAREHLAHLLCEVAMRFEAVGQPTGVLPLTRVELAGALGLSVVQVNRELQGLKLDGLVEPRTLDLEVLDFAGLAQLSSFNAAYLHQERAA